MILWSLLIVAIPYARCLLGQYAYTPICIYIYTYTHIYIYTYMHIYMVQFAIQMHAYICIWYIYTYTHTHTSDFAIRQRQRGTCATTARCWVSASTIHIYTHMYVHVHMNTCIYVYMYTCVYYICIYTYTTHQILRNSRGKGVLVQRRLDAGYLLGEYVYTPMCVYMYTWTLIYIYTCTHVYICKFIYIYTYILHIRFRDTAEAKGYLCNDDSMLGLCWDNSKIEMFDLRKDHLFDQSVREGPFSYSYRSLFKVYIDLFAYSYRSLFLFE